MDRAGRVLDRKARQRGSILGLAVGDALGASIEFQPPGSFQPVTSYRSGGPHDLNAGEWTDDTSMALALLDSIASGPWDLNDQAERYLAWLERGKYSVNGRVFDVGVTTRSGLLRFAETRDAWSSGLTAPSASGNGSIMRLAPVAAAYSELLPDQLELLVHRLVDSSRATHGSRQCLSACAYFGTVLSGLMNGLAREVVLDPNWHLLPRIDACEPLHEEIQEVASGRFRRRKPPQIQGSGHVVASLEAALWAFHDARDFREAVLRAVNLGDDADTTGALCGQLAGAYFGEPGIPAEWLEQLARRDLIEEILQRFENRPAYPEPR